MKIINKSAPQRPNKTASFGSITCICRNKDLPKLQQLIAQNNNFFKPYNIEYQLTLSGNNNLVTLNGFDTGLLKRKPTNIFDMLLLIRITNQKFQAWIAATKTLLINQ